MALVAHKYMPDEMPVEELHATFAAREHTLEYLAKSLRDQCGSKTLTSYLITGPRGSGKTTIVRMVSLRTQEDDKLSKAWLPVRFPEELPGITSLRDLLAATLHTMAEDGIAGAGEWHERVEAEADDEQSQELAISGLRQIATQQNRRLVLFIENLDLVFDRGLNERTLGTLRRLLMDSPFMMIVGTAVKQFEALRAYDEAFFNYFCPVPLDPLDDAQVSSILFRRAEYDGNEQFREQYQRHQGRIKAISRLTGGNPRLVLMLYEAMTHGNLASTVETLRALVDELTPLLKDILEHQFSDQQSKILDALMREGGTATPSKIAKSARLPLNTVTTQLPRLKDMQVVEVRGGGKGRAAYYTVPDQLFCTWYQMRYLRPHRRRIELFVEVLRVWFEEEERLRVMNNLAEEAIGSRGKIARDAATAIEYFAASLAATIHHPVAQEMAVLTWLRSGNMQDAAFALAEDRDIYAADRSGYETAAYAGLGAWSRKHDDIDTAIRALQTAIERTPDDLMLHMYLGVALGESRKHSAARVHFDQVIRSGESCRELQATALFCRGLGRVKQRDTDSAIADFTAVMEFRDAPTEVVARSLVHRAACRAHRDDAGGAIADCTAAVELEGAPPHRLAQALVYRGIFREDKDDTEGAIADYTAVVELKGAPKHRVAEAFLGRGVSKAKQGDTDGAIVDFTTVADLSDAPRKLVAGALFCRACTCGQLSDPDADLCFEDLLISAKEPEAQKEVRRDALALAFAIACAKQDDASLDRVSVCASEGLGHLESTEHFRQLEAVLAQFARPKMKSSWPRALGSLSRTQPLEVVQRLAFFRPVAEILQSGDLSKLDPLPPEQREFVREVLQKFEEGEEQGS